MSGKQFFRNSSKEKLMREENEILNELEEKKQRLGEEKELKPLLNMVKAILNERFSFEPKKIHDIYLDIDKRIRSKYRYMDDLCYGCMRAWHISMFSTIELLRMSLHHDMYGSPEEVKGEVEEVFSEYLPKYLRDFKQKTDCVC